MTMSNIQLGNMLPGPLRAPGTLTEGATTAKGAIATEGARGTEGVSAAEGARDSEGVSAAEGARAA